jgi:hypothetical protein
MKRGPPSGSVLPSEEMLDKILRYETKLGRQMREGPRVRTRNFGRLWGTLAALRRGNLHGPKPAIHHPQAVFCTGRIESELPNP